MKFRKPISYNAVDTHVYKSNGRWVLETGVYQRCRAIIRIMKDRQWRGISDIRDTLSKDYLYRDLYHAANRLRKAGILKHNGYGRWCMMLHGEKMWEKETQSKKTSVKKQSKAA